MSLYQVALSSLSMYYRCNDIKKNQVKTGYYLERLISKQRNYLEALKIDN